MKWFGSGDYTTGIVLDSVFGFIVSMRRAPVTRFYWYSTFPQARRASLYFRAKGRWPSKKNVRNVLHSTSVSGILPK